MTWERFAADMAKKDAEIERLRLREAEYEKQRADYHHVAAELARCERDHDALLHENDSLRSKLAGADQRAATYSNELVMALDAGKRVREERDELLVERDALRHIVAAVASSNPYGSWYPVVNSPAGVVCRWCMERALSPKDCQHDHECTWQQARAHLAAHPAPESEA